MTPVTRITILLCALACNAGASSDFSREISSILEGACIRCHNPEKTKGKLQLHTRQAAFKGGASGPAIIPGKPGQSELIRRVSLPHDDDDIMPQEANPLSNPQIGILREWIEAGAPWPDEVVLRQKKRNEKTLVAAQADSVIPASPPRSLVEAAARVEQILNKENQGKNDLVTAKPISDLAFLRKATIDLVGRIPTHAEINEYRKWPAPSRRLNLVDKLALDPRFTERWTVFFADMLRIRSSATGGNQMLAYVRKAIADAMPYDEMVHEFISANGRLGSNPAVGFVLGDDVDPMALAGATAQVFLGVRLQCAECHDHPFDDWKQKEFYEFAGFFGKTKRVENRFAGSVYTTEDHRMSVEWPPEREQPDSREPVQAKFPFELVNFSQKPQYIARLEEKRAGRRAAETRGKTGSPAIDDLLNIDTLREKTDGLSAADLLLETRKESAALKVKNDLYRPSELRAKLAGLITDPRNPYFARAFTNRIWAELVGRGFVEPLDNFSDYNSIANPQTLNYLSREFIASGYDLRTLIKTIVLSAPYSRGQLDATATAQQGIASQSSFTATRMRRMLSEVLFDSIISAGHLGKKKWPAGANLRTVSRQVRVPIEDQTAGTQPEQVPQPKVNTKAMAREMVARTIAAGYDLEKGIGLDFDEILRKAADEKNGIGEMKMLSDAQIEAGKKAAMMQQQQAPAPMRYRIETIEEKIDDNPSFESTMRMASPAAPAHFLRVFGQPSREGLGEFRDESPSLRQSLMMLNGKASHEAARVGPLEPIHAILQQANGDYTATIRYAYLEILTREPSIKETAEAKALIASANATTEGVADLRWALLNCHEFRFLP